MQINKNETRKASLSWGLFEEEHKYKPIEQYGQTMFDCKTKKIKGFNSEKPLYNDYNFDPVVFAWNVDPLTAKYPYISPYAFALNSPIKYNDIDGREVHVQGSVTSFVTLLSNIFDKKVAVRILGIKNDLMGVRLAEGFTYDDLSQQQKILYDYLVEIQKVVPPVIKPGDKVPPIINIGVKDGFSSNGATVFLDNFFEHDPNSINQTPLGTIFPDTWDVLPQSSEQDGSVYSLYHFFEEQVIRNQLIKTGDYSDVNNNITAIDNLYLDAHIATLESVLVKFGFTNTLNIHNESLTITDYDVVGKNNSYLYTVRINQTNAKATYTMWSRQKKGTVSELLRKPGEAVIDWNQRQSDYFQKYDQYQCVEE